MKKINKKIKFLSLSILGIASVLPLTSCSNTINNSSNSSNGVTEDKNQDNSAENNNSKNDGSSTNNNTSNDKNDSSNENDNTNINGGGDTYVNGSIDTSIANSKSISGLTLKTVSSNTYGLIQNTSDFIENGDFSGTNYVGSLNGELDAKDDILGFLKNVYYSNSNRFSITNVNFANFSFDKTKSSNKIILNQTTINFELTVKISSTKASTFTFLNKSYNLPSNFSGDLTIKVDNQTLLPSIGVTSNGKYYLGWKVNSATITFNGETSTSEFAPTSKTFSKLFYVDFNNLSNQDSYFDLYNEYKDKYEENVTNENSKTLIETNADKDINDFLFYADISKDLLALLSQDIPITQLIQKGATYLVEILNNLNIIPSWLQVVLVEAINGNTDGSSTISDKSLLSVIVSNKQTILDYLQKNYPGEYKLIYPMLSNLSESMTSDNASYKVIQKYISLLPYNFQTIVNNDILGLDGKTPKTLLNIILDNYSSIISYLKSNTSISQLDNILSILKIIFETKDSNYQSIYDTLVGSTENKQKVVDFLGGIFSTTSIADYIKILFTDNTGISKENIKGIISDFSTFANEVFKYKEGANSKTLYTDRYENLVFNKKWISEPVVNKKDGKISLTFSYRISFSLTKEVDLNLVKIKDLLPEETYKTLLKKLLEDNVKTSSSALNSVIKEIASGNSQVMDLRKYLLRYIPDVIKFGVDGKDKNSFNFTYSATNAEVWFNPEKSNSNYYLGFSVGYNLNVYYDDLNMWNSISSGYAIKEQERGSVGVVSTVWYYDFWKSILQNLVMKSYDYNRRFELSDYKTKIADSESYNDNYYYTNLTLENKSNNVSVDTLISTFSTSDSNNIRDKKSEINQTNNLTWRNNWDDKSTTTQEINGIDIITTDTNKQKVQNMMYSVKTNNKSYSNLNYTYDFGFTALNNFKASIDFKIDFGIKFIVTTKTKIVRLEIPITYALFNSNVYFPVKFYDTTNKKLVNHINKTYVKVSATPITK